MNRWLTVLAGLLLTPVAALAQTRPAPPPSPPQPAPQNGTVLRPKTSDSATGYIDNAIVGTQVRLRTDIGFGVAVPDRAEFFYGKCGCYRSLPSSNPAYDPNAAGPGGDGQVENDLRFQEIRFDAEYAVARRVSLFVEVPLRFIQPKTIEHASGFGDVRFGAKYGIVQSEGRAITAQVRVYTPSGDSRRGLGTGHSSIEPELLYHERLSDKFTIAGQFGVWHPIDGSAGIPTSSKNSFAGDVLLYGGGGSVDVYTSGRVRITPVVEMVGWRVMNGFQTVRTGNSTAPGPADGTNIVNLKAGPRFSMGADSFYIGFGHALTGATWYDDILRVEYRHAF